MTPWRLSILSWLGGGIIGAVLAKQHRIAGFIGGAILVGAFADVAIERYHPMYTGLSQASLGWLRGSRVSLIP